MSFFMNGNVVYHGALYRREKLEKVKENVMKCIRKRCQQGKPVALSMKRTPIFLVTIFALLEEKIPFLSIDLSFPEERLKYMLDQAGIDIVITDNKEEITILKREVLVISETCEGEVCELDENNWVSDFSGKKSVDAEDENDVDAIAYLLFTSGTTGLPKAVEVYRSGLINFIQGIPMAVKFPEHERIACLTSQTFDIFFLESVMALCVGMTVVLADDTERANPRMIIRILKENKVNVMQSTPSALRMIQAADEKFSCLKEVKTLMIGGEPLPLSLLKDIQKVSKGKIYNMYGPTETTIWSTVADLTESSYVHIGQPIKDTQIYIVDELLREVADQESGEIVIAGAGLAKGYCKNVEKTNEQFVIMERDYTPIRVYRTGDYGCIDKNGMYICNGRKDDQVKLLGHRIELGDVEGNIQKIEGIKNAMVAVTIEQHMVCFYVPEEETTELNSQYLTSEAAKSLPDYMIPARWIRVPELLYTASQKSDRKAMLAMYCDNQSTCVSDKNLVGERADTTENDEVYCKVLECLGLSDEEGILKMELTSLGIDSVQYIERMVDIEDCFDLEFGDEMLTIGYFTTLEELIQYVRNHQNE